MERQGVRRHYAVVVARRARVEPLLVERPGQPRALRGKLGGSYLVAGCCCQLAHFLHGIDVREGRGVGPGWFRSLASAWSVWRHPIAVPVVAMSHRKLR